MCFSCAVLAFCSRLCRTHRHTDIRAMEKCFRHSTENIIRQYQQQRTQLDNIISFYGFLSNKMRVFDLIFFSFSCAPRDIFFLYSLFAWFSWFLTLVTFFDIIENASSRPPKNERNQRTNKFIQPFNEILGSAHPNYGIYRLSSCGFCFAFPFADFALSFAFAFTLDANEFSISYRRRVSRVDYNDID